MADQLFGGLHCADVRELAAGFVLGALEPDEALAVRAHLAACPDPHPEMAELGSVVPALFESVEPVAPPPALKARILSAAAAERERPPAAHVERATDTPRDSERASERDTQRDSLPGGWASLLRRPVWAGVAMAAVIAAVAIGVGYLGLRQQVDDLTAYRNAVAAVLADASKPGAQLAVLSAGDGSTGPGGFAAVASDGAVTLVMHDLAPTTGSQVYVAWVIEGQNAPVPIGGFEVGADGTASFATTHAPSAAGVTVALTLETSRAVTAPTMPIIAAGAAKA
ncbi:MAG TPA: anti-sigma factor [Candidatus Limnocylindrales bacterium]|nr:anti-sigma factor [Candidatus Limnocylindrales bacterium]